MQIDWFTVIAQVVNFLVLIGLLKRFLYGPIIEAMATREQRIEQRFEQAREQQQKAEEKARKYQEQQSALEEQKVQLIQEARDEADACREKMLGEAEEDSRTRRRALREQVDRERHEFMKDVERRASKHVFDAVARLLQELASTDLAKSLAARFSEQLQSLDETERGALVDAARRADNRVLVESSLALSSSIQGQLTRALHKTLFEGIDVQYRTEEDLVLGLQLTVGQHSLGWTASRYLERLQQEVEQILDETVQSDRAEQAA